MLGPSAAPGAAAAAAGQKNNPYIEAIAETSEYKSLCATVYHGGEDPGAVKPTSSRNPEEGGGVRSQIDVD